ncbi:hypothetical protein [Planctomonas psychrotolerans]|uniref:hypothetical protein n=1 Tax=Planctomonas psychrotolerans TaxID=2528712 RepID=UPI00123BECC1|nr:hypothetical protein [Planctomonas psychrotolerans]
MSLTQPEELQDELFSVLFDEDSITSGSGKTTKFTAQDVELAGRRIDAAGVLPKIAEWRAEDRYMKRGGGRPSLLDDRAILIVSLMLMVEGSRLFVTEMRNVFHYRLTDDARVALGVAGIINTGEHHKDADGWYHRVWRSLHSMIDTWDGWPAPKVLLNREERAEVMSLRDKNMTKRKLERSRWFTNAMLEMTIKAQPRDIRRAWKGAISADQTTVKAPSQKKRWRRDEKTRQEVPKYNLKTREEIAKWVMEIDADLYPIDKSAEQKDHDAATAPSAPNAKKRSPGYKWELTYMANLFIQVAEQPGVAPGHPQLIIAASLGTPNKDTAEHTLAAIVSVKERGHHISRLTVDRGYNGGMKAEDFHIPMKAMNVPLVVDYKVTQKGIKGGKGGAIQVEGAHYCPATPKQLLEATPEMDQQLIDFHTYRARIEERRNYRLKPKEKPDEQGNQPMMCPAFGPTATVECPWREKHPKSSAKPKAVILKRNLPAKPDRICKQVSVSFHALDGVEHDQLLHYGSDEWARTYAHDRNSMESMNEYLKDGPEDLRNSASRRLRGMAAQQYLITMMLVTANLRKIARFILEQKRPRPKSKPKEGRRRDRLGMSAYVRWRERVEAVETLPDLPPPDIPQQI